MSYPPRAIIQLPVFNCSSADNTKRRNSVMTSRCSIVGSLIATMYGAWKSAGRFRTVGDIEALAMSRSVSRR